jgi:hypothetical protein
MRINERSTQPWRAEEDEVLRRAHEDSPEMKQIDAIRGIESRKERERFLNCV